MIITHTHSWHENLEIHIDDEIQIYQNGKQMALETDDDLCVMIKTIFMLTGLTYYIDWETNKREFHKGLKIDGKLATEEESLKICNMLLDQQMQTPNGFKKFKLVYVDTCGCNMGHCATVTGVNIADSEIKTYRNFIEVFGDDPLMYPESVIMRVGTDIPDKFMPKGHNSDMKPVPWNPDPETFYITASWC